MASSKLPPANKSTLTTRVDALFTRVFQHQPQPVYRVLIAFSGGIDSTVLLHVLLAMQRKLQAKADAAYQLQLSAMHVHHGLSPNADAWADHCVRVCAQWGVPLQLRHVLVDKQSGLGVEAAARNARYIALLGVAADFVCLAHHQHDQAETLLLQLARGAGVKGLSAMAAMDGEKRLLRPLLEVSRQEIEQYAQQHALQWVEDESNQNPDFDRNFMRQSVLPVLASQYPGIDKTLARTAQHMADAHQLLTELAQMDAGESNSAPNTQGTLPLEALRALSEARAKNALRWWLDSHGLRMPNAETLNQVLQQLLYARADAAVRVKVGAGYSVRRYAHFAYVVAEVDMEPFQRWWQGESVLILNAQYRLRFEHATGQGIALQTLGNTSLQISSRRGGERFKPEHGRPSRTIQHILQAHTIPPWQRTYYPLVFAGDTLVCIPNIGVDVSMAAQTNEPGLRIVLETTA